MAATCEKAYSDRKWTWKINRMHAAYHSRIYKKEKHGAAPGRRGLSGRELRKTIRKTSFTVERTVANFRGCTQEEDIWLWFRARCVSMPEQDKERRYFSLPREYNSYGFVACQFLSRCFAWPAARLMRS